jgi:hypothetical protein
LTISTDDPDSTFNAVQDQSTNPEILNIDEKEDMCPALLGSMSPVTTTTTTAAPAKEEKGEKNYPTPTLQKCPLILYD